MKERLTTLLKRIFPTDDFELINAKCLELLEAGRYLSLSDYLEEFADLESFDYNYTVQGKLLDIAEEAMWRAAA